MGGRPRRVRKGIRLRVGTVAHTASDGSANERRKSFRLRGGSRGGGRLRPMGDAQESATNYGRSPKPSTTTWAVSDWHACFLLACSAVGALAGALAPTIWFNWTGWPWAGVAVIVCLLVPLAGMVVLAGLTGQLGSGLLLLVGAVGVSVAVLALTSFAVGPSALVGLWLLGSGLLSWRERRDRTAVVVSGVVVLAVGLSQVLAWRLIPLPVEASMVVLNIAIVGFLAWQAVSAVPTANRQPTTP